MKFLYRLERLLKPLSLSPPRSDFPPSRRTERSSPVEQSDPPTALASRPRRLSPCSPWGKGNEPPPLPTIGEVPPPPPVGKSSLFFLSVFLRCKYISLFPPGWKPSKPDPPLLFFFCTAAIFPGLLLGDAPAQRLSSPCPLPQRS